MRIGRRAGFTVVEALLALILIAVGLLALVGSAALTSRMVGSGGTATRAALMAAGRIEWLRRIASSTLPPCVSAEWRSDSAGWPGVSESWELEAAGPVGKARIILRSRHPGGTSIDTVVAGFHCGLP